MKQHNELIDVGTGQGYKADGDKTGWTHQETWHFQDILEDKGSKVSQ